MRTEKELAALLEELQYPWEQFTVDHFIEHIGLVMRKRRMNVVDVENLPLPWCASGLTMDYIFYSASVSRILQNHHKLHEAGHFVFGHTQSIKFLDEENVIELVGGFYGHFRSTMPMASSTATQEENEAEYFVYLVHKQLHTYKRLHELTSISHRKDLFIPPFSGTFSKYED